MAASSDHQQSNDQFLPPKPTPPYPTDCCGTGCVPCVNELYEQELSQWLHLQRMSITERREWYNNKKLLAAASDIPLAISRESFKQFPIVAMRTVTGDSILFSFGLPDHHILGTGIGQHVVLRMTDDNGDIITRQYTPVSAIDRIGSFDIVIKIYNNGKASQRIKKWQIGTVTEWKGPFGGLSYTPNQYKQLLMIACGTGIAPIIQVTRHILENENDYTQVYLLYSLKTQEDILLKDLLDTFKDYWNFKVIYVLSRASSATLEINKGYIKYGDHVRFGRINETVIEEELTPINNSDHYLLLCGTKSFVKDMTKLFLHLGLKRDRIFNF